MGSVLIWAQPWIIVVVVGLSPILAVFIGAVLRRKPVVHRLDGDLTVAERWRAVQTLSNRHITVGLDGIVEMSEAFPETLGRTGHDG